MELISSPCCGVSQMIKDLWKCFETIKHNTKGGRYYSEKGGRYYQRFYDKGDLPYVH